MKSYFTIKKTNIYQKTTQILCQPNTEGTPKCILLKKQGP